jgi:hypothetical protein
MSAENKMDVREISANGLHLASGELGVWGVPHEKRKKKKKL